MISKFHSTLESYESVICFNFPGNKTNNTQFIKATLISSSKERGFMELDILVPWSNCVALGKVIKTMQMSVSSQAKGR